MQINGEYVLRELEFPLELVGVHANRSQQWANKELESQRQLVQSFLQHSLFFSRILISLLVKDFFCFLDNMGITIATSYFSSIF
jgi:hypothetical protein